MININFGDRCIDVHLKDRQVRIKHNFINSELYPFGVIELTEEFRTVQESLVFYLDKTTTERLIGTLTQLLMEFRENEEQT
jgi:hypothetical protein